MVVWRLPSAGVSAADKSSSVLLDSRLASNFANARSLPFPTDNETLFVIMSSWGSTDMESK